MTKSTNMYIFTQSKFTALSSNTIQKLLLYTDIPDKPRQVPQQFTQDEW